MCADYMISSALQRSTVVVRQSALRLLAHQH